MCSKGEFHLPVAICRRDLKATVEQRSGKRFHNKSMGGWTPLLLLMQMCRSVDIFGLEAFTPREHASALYHNHDNVQGAASVHSYDLAMEVFGLLMQVYPLNIVR